MGFNLGKAVNSTFGGGSSFGDFVSQTGNTLSGTSKDAGVLGVGQYKAAPVNIDQGAFNDSSSAGRQDLYAHQIADAQGRQAPQIQAAQLGAAAQMNAARLGPAAQAHAAQIATGAQDQTRANQMQLVNQLQAQAAGQGPSLATAQLNQGRDAAINQAMALAASGHGMNAGAAQRQAALQAASATGNAANQAAQMRIQEQQAAQQQLGGVLSGAREQDLGLATSQAGLAQQAGLANQDASNQFALQQAGMQQQAGLANQASLNDFALHQADLSQNASLANQNAGLQMTGLNDAQVRGMSQLSQQDALAQQQAQMSYQQMLVNQNMGINQINSGAYDAASQARAGLVGGLGQGMAASGTGSNIAGNFSSLGSMFSDERLKTDIADGSAVARQVLKTIGTHAYSYKDETHGEGTHVSPMAQELEKTPLGKSLVVDTPEGKLVHTGKANGFLMAVAAMQDKRLETLEEQNRKLLIEIMGHKGRAA